jgi:hypothetical protein
MRAVIIDVAQRNGGGLGLVLHHDVDHAVGLLNADRPDLAGGIGAEPAALDHGRSADAEGAVPGGNDDVADAEQHHVACEAVAGVDAHDRHYVGQVAKLAVVADGEEEQPVACREGVVRRDGGVGRARSQPPARDRTQSAPGGRATMLRLFRLSAG